MKLKLLMFCLLCLQVTAFSSQEDQYVSLGVLTNDLILKGSKAVTVSSGLGDDYNSSVELIDLENFNNDQVVSYEFGKDNHLYSAAFHLDDLLISDWSLNTIYKMPSIFSEDQTKAKAFIVKNDLFSNHTIESMLVIQNHLYISVVNFEYKMIDGSMKASYGLGKVLVYDIALGQKRFVQSLITPQVNPRSMLYKAGLLFISTGDYSPSKTGGVYAIDPSELPFDGSEIDLSDPKNKERLKVRLTMKGGTAGSIYYDHKNHMVYACELTMGTGNDSRPGSRFYRYDTQTHSSSQVRREFDWCGSILGHKNSLYVMNLNGGGFNKTKFHLYVYDKTSLKRVCRKTFLEEQLGGAVEFFPGNLKLYSGQDQNDYLLFTISGRETSEWVIPGLLGKIPLDEAGVPVNCLKDSVNN